MLEDHALDLVYFSSLQNKSATSMCGFHLIFVLRCGVACGHPCARVSDA